MKPFLFMLFLFLASFAASAHGADTQLLDQVVAVVNDEVITQSEVDMLLRPFYEEYQKEYHGEMLVQKLNDARKKLLNQLIEDKLVFQEAKNQKIEVDEVEVDRQMEAFKKRFPSDAELEQALQKEGLTMKDMRDRIQRQALIRRLHDQEIRSKVIVSPLEVEEYYKNHPGEFSNRDSLRVRSLTIKKNDEAREKGLTDEPAKNKILSLRKKILAGADFGNLAKINSEDTTAKDQGLGDWIERGAMIPAIDDVIFNLKTRQVSDLVETPMGYHIFRVEERREGKKKSLDEAREEIFNKLYSEKAHEHFNKWMSDLKKNAYISIR